MNKILKKMVSGFLALASAATAINFPALSLSTPVSADIFTTKDNVTINVQYYQYTYNFQGSGLTSIFGQIPKMTADGSIAYCINSLENSGGGGDSKAKPASNPEEADSNLSLALAYGYLGTTKYGYSADVERLATQIMVWCIQDGWYNTKNEKTAVNLFTANMGSIASSVRDVYYKMKEQMGQHTTVPSFAAQSSSKAKTYMMDSNGDGTYTLTLKDSNSVANQYDWAAAAKKNGLTVKSVTANSVTFTSNKPIVDVTLEAARIKGKYCQADAVAAVKLVPMKGQDCEQEVTAAQPVKPKTASIKISADEGQNFVTIVKTSDDGAVSDISFKILNSSGTKEITTLTTDENGKTPEYELNVGSYIAREVVPMGYAPQADKKFTITSAAPTTVTFENDTVQGPGSLKKTFEKVNGVAVTAEVAFVLEAVQLIAEDAEFETRTDILDKDGSVSWYGLPEGTYRVTENAPSWYVPNAPKTVVIAADDTAEVSFYNELKRGNLQVVKNSEDEVVQGFRFHLYGTADCGVAVDEYATTDSSGVARFSDILIGTYTLEEVDIPIRYVKNDAQTVRIRWENEETISTANFFNILKKFRVRVAKADVETGAPQGDATLAGAVYGLYCNDVLVDTYSTDEQGVFTTMYYPCDYAGTGHEYYLQEIAPSEGYLLDETKYPVKTDPALYTVEYNTTGNETYEQVIKGNIAIIKHNDEGDTQIETPETGSVFEIYLKSSGSYLNAKETERDVLTCDDSGFAQSKDLPYGVYTVHQTIGWEGRELIEDFDVYIAKDGFTYEYLINNNIFYSYVRIIKVDTETGKTIPYAGAAFHLYNPDGSMVTMTYTYPQLTTIDTFYTNANGELLTPESLIYGKGYSLEEIQAPYGYVLNSEKIYFDVVQSNSEKEEGYNIIEVERDDMPQKGKIVITKTGEIFASVAENGGTYQPVYSVAPLAGATYEIHAAEDIYTLDGTLRYAKDELVETITTGADGIATSKEIYLGKYYVKEIKAPEGYYLSDVEEETTHYVALTYKGQEYELTDNAETAYNNDRQHVALSLLKALEQDNLFKLGMNGEIKNVKFGLYAAETLTAADNKTIPADGLIEAVNCAADGTIAFKSDVPFGRYYVKEISTDEHYILNGEKFEVTFEYKGQDIAVVEIAFNGGNAINNELIRGNIHGEKVNLENPDEKLANALIGLFPADTTEFVEANAYMTDISDNKGAFAFENVPYGTYIVREIAAPESFVLNENPYYVTIDEDGETVDVVVTDKPIYGNISLTKIDAEYPENKLSGAVFEIYKDVNKNGKFDNGDTFVDTLNEVETGIYTRMHLRYGGYFVKEKTAPEGFLLDENTYYVFIAEDEKTYEVENVAGVGFANQPIKGNLELLKVDADNINVALHGAEFTVYADTNKNGAYDEGVDKAAGTMAETKDGIYRLDEVRYGQYFVIETKAPEGFLRDERIYPVFIKEHGETYVIKNVTARTDTEGGNVEYTDLFADLPIIGNIKLVKVNYTYQNIKLSDAIFAVYADTNKNGTYDSADKRVGEMSEYIRGEYVMDGLRYGQYFVVEERAPFGYQLDKGVYPVFIKEHGKTEYVSNSENGFFTNKPLRPIIGNIKVVKADADYPDSRLSGAEFTVHYDVNFNGVLDGEDINLGVMRELPNGEHIMRRLVFGLYFVQETKAPEGFLLDDNIYSVFISQFGKTEVVSNAGNGLFLDAPIRGNVTLTKYDADYPDNKLSGAEFEVYADTDKNGAFDENDILAATMEETEDGIYTATDLRYGGYFVKEKTAPEGFLLDENAYYVFISENGKTYAIENEAGVGFADQPIRGNIEVIKVNSYNLSTKLSGAEFEVYADTNKNGEFDDDDKLEGTMSYTENGVYRLENVRYGKYFVKETKAPDGYQLDTRVYSVDVTQNEQTVFVSNTSGSLFANKPNTPPPTPAPGSITLTKVDADDNNVRLAGAEFEVWKDANGNKQIDESDTFCGTMAYSDNGIYTMSALTAGGYLVKETKAPEGYQLDENTYYVTVYVGSISTVKNVGDYFANRHLPEIHTTASANGEKEVFADGTITIDDIVTYKNLTVGKSYTVKGTLMNKATGAAFVVKGQTVTAETTFVAETENGSVTVTFTFDGSGIKDSTDLVVFEKLFEFDVESGIEGDTPIAEHEDFEDKDQTVTVLVPIIKTTATVDGKKDVTGKATVTIDDVVSYSHLVVGKTYTVKGTLMDKATGKPFTTTDGKPVTAETTFMAETTDGTVTVSFTFDASNIVENTDIVVFESLYEGDSGILIARHNDITDLDQTVTIHVDDYNQPTGTSVMPQLMALAAASVLVILARKRKNR